MIVQENLAHFLTFEHQFMITLLHDHDKKKGKARALLVFVCAFKYN